MSDVSSDENEDGIEMYNPVSEQRRMGLKRRLSKMKWWKNKRIGKRRDSYF